VAAFRVIICNKKDSITSEECCAVVSPYRGAPAFSRCSQSIVDKRQYSSAASFTHSSTSTAPFMESRAAINVVAACKHAAFSEVFSSLVTRRDLLVGAPNANEGLSSTVSLCRPRIAQPFIERAAGCGLSPLTGLNLGPIRRCMHSRDTLPGSADLQRCEANAWALILIGNYRKVQAAAAGSRRAADQRGEGAWCDGSRSALPLEKGAPQKKCHPIG